MTNLAFGLNLSWTVVSETSYFETAYLKIEIRAQVKTISALLYFNPPVTN